jgi:hypothetical protein
MGTANWLYTLLNADTTIKGKVGDRVFRDSAPEGTGFPFIVYQLIDSVPVTNAFKDILMDGERWQIKAVDKGNDYSNVEAIASRCITLFHKKSDSGEGVVSCTLDWFIESSEVDDGITYKSGILDFRVHTQ